MSTIDPLKEELADTITSCRKLEQRVKECQREIQLEKETQNVLEKQHANKVRVYTCLQLFYVLFTLLGNSFILEFDNDF